MKPKKHLNQKVNIKKHDKDFYIVLSARILDLDLNAGEKLTLAMIVSLSRQNGKSTATVRTMSDMIGVSVRTMQNYIAKLVELEYIIYSWVGHNRHFKPLESLKEDRDAKAIITSDILKNQALTATYKITQGMIIARGINTDQGGYRFETMESLAEYIGLSISSAYRHINELLKAQTIKRHKEYKLMFISNDFYSKAHHESIKDFTKIIESSKTIPLDPYVDETLDEIFKSMR